MPKLKRLSGADIIVIFAHFGFIMASQKGSHVKLQRMSLGGAKQTLTIPCHKELDAGTIRAIYRQAFCYLSERELREHFYHD